jgi:hypothetical protein
MDPTSTPETTAAVYASVSHAMVFTGVALSFVGLGWSLTLMLRPKTSALCIWSLTLFSLGWLIESSTHLLGVGSQVPVEFLRYGVWTAAVLFGVGLVVGVFGVLAYLRNEHRYQRGLTIGVFASMAHLWVVGGIVTALRHDRTSALGRGLVIPVMTSGGPVDLQALASQKPRAAPKPGSEAAQKLGAMLGRAISDVAAIASPATPPAWHVQPGGVAGAASLPGPGASSAALPGSEDELIRALQPGAQHQLTSSAGWMSLALDAPALPATTGIPAGNVDDAARLAAQDGDRLAARAAPLSRRQRLRALRTSIAGFEVIRVSTLATMAAEAHPRFFDQWVAVAGGQSLRVLASSPATNPEFQATTEDLVTAVLRNLQREGWAGPVPSEAAQRQLQRATQFEKEEHFDEALGAWQQAVSGAPADAECFLGVLRCWWKLGRAHEAVAWLDAAGVAPPATVSAAVGVLRIRTAAGQPGALESLQNRFHAGLADDAALASLLLSFVTRNDRAAGLQALSTLGDRHAEPMVAWWRTYLSAPPGGLPVERPVVAPGPSGRSQGEAEAAGKSARRRPTTATKRTAQTR